MHEDEVLAKAVVKLRVDMFCLAWCSNSLRTGKGTLPIGAPVGLWRNTDFGKIRIQLLNFILIRRLSHLYHLAVEGGGLIYLPSGKFAAWKSCSNLSKHF